MREKSFVYILQHANEPIVKIGRSDRPLQRASKLADDIDISKSVVIEVQARHAMHVEKMLHFVAYEHGVQRPHGDGYTEWFAQSALPAVRAFLERSSLHLRIEPISVPKPDPNITSLRMGTNKTAALRPTRGLEVARFVAQEQTIRAFIAVFKSELHCCAIYRDVQGSEATIYVRGAAMNIEMGDHLLALARACDVPLLNWMLSASHADNELVMRLSLRYLSQVRCEGDECAAADLRAWFECIPDLPASGKWRRRLESFEKYSWQRLLEHVYADAGSAPRPGERL